MQPTLIVEEQVQQGSEGTMVNTASGIGTAFTGVCIEPGVLLGLAP
jgi:hypothetical protein